jgi:parvulin-like peptidyl-prolyl isomerase
MSRYLALVAAVAMLGMAVGAERPANPPLVVNGDLSLTTADFEAYLEKVPEKMRPDFRANLERVRPTVDGLWVYRLMAKKAREAGLADDPLVAARAAQASDAVLAEAYMKQAEKKIVIPDLTPRARELYAVRQKEFTLPEKIHVQHILVATNDCRNAEQALARAKEIRARLEGADSKAFLAEAQKSSDDPSRKTNKGDLGLVATSTLEAPFVEAVSKMKVAGEVSAPFETRYGYHIVRFVAREPSRVQTFDEVKEDLLAAERQKLVDVARNAVVNAVRTDPGNHVYVENVEALAKAGKGSGGTPASKP